MPSSFSGKFVPNTYENLLQIGQNNLPTGNVAFTDPNGDTHTIVDAFGRRVQGVVIDQNQNGGLYFKRGSSDLHGFAEDGQEFAFLRYTTSNSIESIFQINEDGAIIGLDHTSTFDGFVRAEVKDGVYIKANSSNNESKILVSSAGQTPDGKLVVVAENDEYSEIVEYIPSKNHNCISSGVQIDRNNGGVIYYVNIWSKSGSVITCDVWIDHDNNNTATSVFDIPVYVGAYGDPVYESFTGLVGHGINFNTSPQAQFPSQAVEFKSVSQYRYQVTNTGYAGYTNAQGLYVNPITTGITRGRFSYRLIT